MAIEVRRSDLQTDKYSYTWKRDKGDGTYAGPLDRAKVDKDEGYEVVEFIENLMNANNRTFLSEAHAVEDALHAPALSRVVFRTELIHKVKLALGW